MAQVGSVVTKKFRSILAADSGMPATVSVIADLEGIQLPFFTDKQVIAENVAAELIERSTAVRYPTLHVYCAKVVNTLREKFRTFSGEAHMVVEVRLSQDRVEGLERQTQLYTDAVTRVLDEHRGDVGCGFFYCGAYEIAYGPVKHGGRNFLQVAKVSFTVEVSTN